MNSIRPHIPLRPLALGSLGIAFMLVLWFLPVPSATGDSSRSLTPDQKI